MNLKKIQYWFILFASLQWISCANIMSPTGGPRDEKAPVITQRSLKDSSLNFKGGNIEFNFDEFVQVKDIQNQVIITPLLKANPKITAHKHHVIINMADSLLSPNTTYTIAMGKAIQDIHESNAFDNLNFTFSTGAYFDSLSLKGAIYDAKTGKLDTSCYAVLYPSGASDSVITKEKPMYAQRATSGGFFFKNLPKRNFNIYALKDINKNLKYDASGERIAFYDNILNASDSTLIKLFVFEEDVKVDSNLKKANALFQARLNTTVKSTSTKFEYIISADTSAKTKRTFDITDSIAIRFTQKIKSIDESKIRLYQGNELDASATIHIDSTNQNLFINTQWTEDALYTIKLLKGFAIDSSNVKATSSEFQFKTKRKSDYGVLTVHCKTDKNNLIELLKNDVVIAKKYATDTLINFPFLAPFDHYQIRTLIDQNHNGKWDTGIFLGGRKQPERVILFPNLIAIKANWENKVELTTTEVKGPSKK